MTETLGNRESELKALLLKQNKVKETIEAETRQLIADRTKEFRILEASWQKRIEELENRYPDLKEQIKKQQLALSDVTSEIVGAQTELARTMEAVSVVQAQVVSERGNAEIYISKLEGIKAQITEVSQRIAPLHAEKLELEETTVKLNNESVALKGAIELARGIFEEEKIKHARELHNLESRAQEVALKIQEDEKTWKRVSDELATRETVLNKREETLAHRELKVTRDERNLARNNELLSL